MPETACAREAARLRDGGRIPATGPACLCARLCKAAPLPKSPASGGLFHAQDIASGIASHSFIDGLCGCGVRHSGLPSDRETRGREAVEQALLHGLFPTVLRRTLLKSVGAATVLGALSSLLRSTRSRRSRRRRSRSKRPSSMSAPAITCAAPLIYGEQPRPLRTRRPRGQPAEDSPASTDPTR